MSLSKKQYILLIALIASVFFGALEAVAYFLLSPADRKLPAEVLFQSYHNEYLEDHARRSGCTFPESLIAHPMLGFVHRKKEYASSRCRFVLANNIGIAAERDLPLKKNENEFALFLLGGSVAEHLANYRGKDGSYYLEKILNEKFIPPRGTRFTVYNGAMGAWAMPAQINMLLMYGERVDGAISLDGYNESFSLQEGARHEGVPTATYILSFSDSSSMRILGLRFLWAYQYVLSRTWLKHSYFFNATYRTFTGMYERHVLNPELLDEFSKGNTEELNLSESEKRDWSLQSLKRYMESFHQLGSAKKILTAEFLQPSRHFGKTLTAEEKSYREYIEPSVYKNLDQTYQSMSSAGWPVRSLTSLFANETGSIYADHIHYNSENGVSRGAEMVAGAIADELGRLWKLKKR